jgi:hypothetical protein
MASHYESTSELRRFLAINFRVGSLENGYLVGPVLVSTRDYKRFHFWDEPSAAVLSEDDYEVVKVYRLGLSYDEVTRLFAKDFAPATTQPFRSAGWRAPDGSFYSAQGWANFGQHPILAA